MSWMLGTAGVHEPQSSGYWRFPSYSFHGWNQDLNIKVSLSACMVTEPAGSTKIPPALPDICLFKLPGGGNEQGLADSEHRF